MPAPISINSTVTTSCGEKFKTISKHRGTGIASASRWTITISEEYDCFIKSLSYCNGTNSITYTSSDNSVRWGVTLDNNKLTKLGENNICNFLVFAKFTKHAHNSEWHGYPSDYRNKVQDRPQIDFLTSLSDNSIISKSKVNKIMQGKICSF